MKEIHEYALASGHTRAWHARISCNERENRLFLSSEYAFTGYLGERLAVMLAHGLLTALFVAGIWSGRWQAAAGYLGTFLLHLLINAGAILASLELISPAATSLSLLAGLAILAILFERMRATAIRCGEEEDRAGEVVYFRRDREP